MNIPDDKEKQARFLLSLGWGDLSVARHLKLSKKTIVKIRRMRSIIDNLKPARRDLIRNLIVSGCPISAIAIQLMESKSVILAVKRFYFLNGQYRTESSGSRCETCGSILFHPSWEPAEYVCREPLDPSRVERITDKDVLSLYRTAEEVVSLYGQGVIYHPLFHYLARRTEELLNEISNRTMPARESGAKVTRKAG